LLAPADPCAAPLPAPPLGADGAAPLPCPGVGFAADPCALPAPVEPELPEPFSHGSCAYRSLVPGVIGDSSYPSPVRFGLGVGRCANPGSVFNNCCGVRIGEDPAALSFGLTVGDILKYGESE
jgi:hypothetical protein